MAQEKKGFIARMLEGKERSEEYARSTLPTNRWQLFFDIFKGNFGKIVKVNLLTILFFIPLIIVIIFNFIAQESYGYMYPFGANLTMGYPAAPNQQGLSELLTVQSEFGIYLAIIVASVIASVGLAGGMYVVRNMVWTEGIFVANDFWKGVKLNFWNALQAALSFSVVLFLCKMVINLANFTLVTGGLDEFNTFMINASIAVSYVIIIFAAMITFWMIALGVNYQLSVWNLFKNAFLIAVGTFPQTIFFGALALLPLLCFIIGGEFMIVAGCVCMLLFGVAYALLVWLDFAQWVFDKFINPKLEGAKVGRGIYNKDGTSPMGDSGAALEYQRAILAAGRSRLVARPIKPIDDSLQVYELPQAFTREDLKRLRESKQTLLEDAQAYEEEHKNDEAYVEYNRQFDEREKALQDAVDANGKKKKRKPPRLLGDE